MPGKRYTVRATASLTPGLPFSTLLKTNLLADGASTIFTDASGGTNRFYRIEVEQ